MATIESLQAEISNLRQDIVKLNNEMVKRPEFNESVSKLDLINRGLTALNFAFTAYQGVQVIKLGKLSAGLAKTQFMAQSALNKSIGAEMQMKAIQARLTTTATTANVAKSTATNAKSLATKLAPLTRWVGILVAFAGTALNIYGSLKIIERIDEIERKQLEVNLNLTEMALKARIIANKATNLVTTLGEKTKETFKIVTGKHEQLVKTTKQEDIKIRADFKKADTQITTNFKKADTQITTNFKKADTQITTDFKKADNVIKSSVSKVDAKAIKAQKTADIVTTNHNKLSVSFNGFSARVDNWIKDINKSVTKSYSLIKKSNTTANNAKDTANKALIASENAITSINETKSKINNLEGQVNTTIKGLEDAKIKHDNLVGNFTKLKALVNEWTIEVNKSLNYLSRNIYEIQQQLKKIMNLDLTPLSNKIDNLQKNNERSHKDTQSMLNAGLVTIGVGMTANKLQLAGMGTQLGKMSVGMSTGFTNLTQVVNNGFKTVGTATTSIAKGITGVGNKIKDLAGKFDFSFILNLISAAASLHNAIMLSQNVLQTFFMVFDNLFQIFGINDADGNPLNIFSIIGKQIQDIIKSAIGVKTYEEINQKWNAYNRIYQAATNSFYAMQNLISTVMDFSVNMCNNLGKIGNALLTHVFDEDEYATMPDDITKTGRLKWLNGYTGSANEVLQFASALQQITGDVLSITQEAKELQEATAEFNKVVEESTQKVEAKKTTENTDSGLIFPDAEMSVLDIFEGGL